MNKNKTKAELLELIEELEEKIKSLEDDVEYWQCEYDDMEEECNKLDEQLTELEYVADIRSLDNFIWKLKLDNLYTEELEEFICNYVKLYND